MRVVCLADLHGYLPEVPPCDVLLVAGDICPTGDERPETQRTWLHSTFARWLADVPAATVVGVAGNHDFVGETDPSALRDLDWHYLQDETIEIDGLSVYGSPWTSRFQEWAFMLTEEELSRCWEGIPTPSTCCACTRRRLGYGDWISGAPHRLALAAGGDRRPRSEALRVRSRASGLRQLAARRDELVNAAHCDMQYLPAHPPVALELG